MRMITQIDREALRIQFRRAKPFPFIVIDNFLARQFADEVAAAYPSFEGAKSLGKQFAAVNERRKIQIVNYDSFPAPVKQLSDAISSQEFLSDLEHITGIPHLEWDPAFAGGGMHQTASHGWLDVHIDFNFHTSLKMYRRLNILVFLNPEWTEPWGGRLELWDKDVKVCHHSFLPIHNRCVVFETSEISFHGVTPVTCPEGIVRRSFAAYYYTKEAPEGWSGNIHSTIFKARPSEYLKGYLLMPVERVRRSMRHGIGALRGAVKDILRSK